MKDLMENMDDNSKIIVKLLMKIIKTLKIKYLYILQQMVYLLNQKKIKKFG